MTKAIGVLIALAILAAPVLWQVALHRQETNAAAESLQPTRLEEEVSLLRAELDALRSRVDGLDARTAAGLAAAVAAPPAPERTAALPPPDAPRDSLRDAFDQVVLIADRRSFNDGLTVASPRFLASTFGLPRQDLNDRCQSMANPRLRDLLRTEDVGPIRARLLAPAIASIRSVFAQVQEFEPELYARIASSGSLCVRLIRGSAGSASAHAYGLAVDINIDGQLDNFADGKTQLGLILMADFFKKEGWIWGAGFRREDSMHFEVSREKIEEWRRDGLL